MPHFLCILYRLIRPGSSLYTYFQYIDYDLSYHLCDLLMHSPRHSIVCMQNCGTLGAEMWNLHCIICGFYC